MINLQNSKKLIKTYDELLSTVFPLNGQPRKISAFNKTIMQSKSFQYKTLNHKQQNYEKAKKVKESPFINIEFQQNAKMKQNEDVKNKRKAITSSEKNYCQKKTAYSNYIKEIYSKINDQLKKKNHFMTVGTHAIRKMDYASTINRQKQPDSFQQKIRMREKLKVMIQLPEMQIQNPFQITRSLNKANLGKIVEKLKQKKPQKQRKSMKEPQSFRVLNLTNMNYKTAKSERTNNNSFSQKKTSKTDDFVPLRKIFHKKQPFVFGMSDKHENLQKFKDKVILYHDFIWKVNFANGLCIKPTEQETTYRAFIGPGNNSSMIKSILKRRFWWSISDKTEGCNFVWNQLKIGSIFKDIQKMAQNKACEVYSQLSKSVQIQCQKVQNTKDEGIINQHQKIFNSIDILFWSNHHKKNRKTEANIGQKTYLKRINNLFCKKKIMKVECSKKLTVHNHLQQNFFIGNKKALFYNMRNFYEHQDKDVFEALPLTFHVTKGVTDPQYQRFVEYFHQIEKKKNNGSGDKNIWILKPGENSNRGNGITVCFTLDQINYRLKSREKNSDGNLRTFIIQKYMEKPLLYKQRKFDIRHFLLITCINGCIKAYWFPEGYIRTSSVPFSLKKGTNLYTHLTNDAIQKNCSQYGKHEKGNKISYEKFQNYLEKTVKNTKNVFFDNILPQMKKLTIDAVKSTFLTLDEKRKKHNFQLLGMDFMIDENLKPWLIEINTNPCLQLSSPLLNRLIPEVIQNTFRLCVDPLFPPPEDWPTNKKIFINDNPLIENRFQLVFDESVDGQQVENIFGGDYKIDQNIGKIEEDTEIFENDGQQDWEDKQNNN